MKKYIMSVLTFILGIIIGKKSNKTNIKKKNTDDLATKHLAIMLMYDQWLKTKQEGKTIVNYFLKHKYNKIAIYGFSYVGERLYDELRNTDIKVQYVIDKRASDITAEVEAINPEMNFEKVDAIIVTSNYYYMEIKELLREKVDCPIINLENILYEI